MTQTTLLQIRGLECRAGRGMRALEFERGLGLGSGSLADLKEVINGLSLEHVEGRCHQTPVPVDGDIFKTTPSRQVKKCLPCVDPHIKTRCGGHSFGHCGSGRISLRSEGGEKPQPITSRPRARVFVASSARCRLPHHSISITSFLHPDTGLATAVKLAS